MVGGRELQAPGEVSGCVLKDFLFTKIIDLPNHWFELSEESLDWESESLVLARWPNVAHLVPVAERCEKVSACLGGMAINETGSGCRRNCRLCAQQEGRVDGDRSAQVGHLSNSLAGLRD